MSMHRHVCYALCPCVKLRLRLSCSIAHHCILRVCIPSVHLLMDARLVSPRQGLASYSAWHFAFNCKPMSGSSLAPWVVLQMHLGLWRKLRVTLVLALTFTAEHADTMLLSAMYLAIGTSLHIGPTQLGNLSMFRSLVTVQSTCSTFLARDAAIRPCTHANPSTLPGVHGHYVFK